jgi:SAM-dependent methyltransferase
MVIIDQVHEGYVFARRVRVLAELLAARLPHQARVLDIGCGDGRISQAVRTLRPDVAIEGIDVLVRPKTHIPVTPFDGARVPFADASFDVVMFVDVLHHTTDPTILLREAARVTRRDLVIKDHTRDGWLAGPTLRFMDYVGNARHGVALPGNYWPERRWRETFRALDLEVVDWTQKIPLYPWWAAWLFGRSLHFLARLTVRAGTATA